MAVAINGVNAATNRESSVLYPGYVAGKWGDGFELHVFGAIVFVKKICGKGSELYITGL